VVEPDRPYMTIWRMLIAFWVLKATHTHTLTICNTYSFVTGTVVARTRLCITLYVNFLPCFFAVPYTLRKVGLFYVRQIFRFSTAVTVKITVLDM